MNTFIRCIDNLSDWAAWISGVLLGLMTLLILVEIFLWNVMQKTTLIADEYCAYGLAAIIFLGAGYWLDVPGGYYMNPGLDLTYLVGEDYLLRHYVDWQTLFRPWLIGGH